MTGEWRGVIFLSDVHFTDRSYSQKNSRSSFDHSDFDVNLQEARKKAEKISNYSRYSAGKADQLH
ncbi:hypothetical protein [Bacillus vallismortis]|uniref:hypothetical protein n=1 Tax=Bacillus vallismortis TaxID=72361 RepID=UPI00227F34D5|nr:hypothetical protein [Bacillus vallismortis]MCY8596311.1 hypothetical protein [Bacillus vallismortis]